MGLLPLSCLSGRDGDQFDVDTLVQGSLSLNPNAILSLVKEKLQSKKKDVSYTLQMQIENYV